MKIYRIDGNICFKEPIPCLSYHSTKELAEKHLTELGFYLETRNFDEVYNKYKGNIMWYNKELSEDGYPYDNTEYRFITEINVNES